MGWTGWINPNTQKPLLQKLGVLGAFLYTEWDSLSKTYVIIQNLNDYRRIDSLVSPTQPVCLFTIWRNF